MSMDKPTARPPDVVAGDEVLDGTDPHAGDDADWESHEARRARRHPRAVTAAVLEGSAAGLLLSTAMWCVVAAVAFALYKTLID